MHVCFVKAGYLTMKTEWINYRLSFMKTSSHRWRLGVEIFLRIPSGDRAYSCARQE